MQTGQPQVLERELPGLDGIFLISKYPLHDKAGTAVATVHTFQDITKRKRMEQQLLHSERLSAMGRLAASVAHEINNPLQSVIGCLSLAREELSEEDDLEQYLRIAHEEVRRAARTVGQLRDLGRSEVGERELAQVNALLEEVLTLSRKQCQESDVEVVWKPGQGLPPLPLETDQIKQVFLNLLFNALEAMPQGGRLEITTSYTAELPEICIQFSDTGVGIAPDVLPHVFEPFYSTKRQGMGLGLSVSYGIVEQHRGRIEVESQVASGSTFTIWLPL